MTHPENNLSPLCPNLCKTKNIVYRCRVTPPNNSKVETYTGLTSQTLKKRWEKHMSDCRRGCGTTLATFVGKLRNSGVDIDIFAHLEWAVKKHATPFNPVSSQCFLCLYEKYFILWERQDATLNKRTEILSSSAPAPLCSKAPNSTQFIKKGAELTL